MTSKGRQQNEPLSSSPPDNVKNIIPPTPPSIDLSLTLSQPVNEQTSEDRPWGNRTAHFEHPNDRFIHETVPPTAQSVLRTQPAFISKLYKMLEDETQDLICWSSNGDYFSVYNSVLFSKQILPQYFKHNNWQSFVRQLNMYGFSKINEMIHSNISFENQTWDFKHPHFKRGDLQSLILVKRKPVKAPGSLPTHLNIAGPSFTASPHPLHHNQANEGGIDSTIFPDAPSSLSPLQQQQHPSHFDITSIDEDVGVESRVMHLDRQVLEVSQRVTHLTSEMQDIKSLIYNQKSLICDLAELLRSYRDTIDSSTTHMTATPTSPSSVSVDEFQQRTTSLPSIHNLANNLRHAANIDTPGSPLHQQPYPYTSMPDTIHSFPTSSSKSSPPHQPSHQGSRYSPHSDDSHSQRRSSHPPSNNPQHQSPHSIYPLLNSTLDHNNPYARH